MVTIDLKPEVIVDEVFEQVRNQLLCSEVEVTLSLDDEKFKIPIVTPIVSDEYLLESKLPKKKELEIETFKWGGTLGNTDLALSLIYQLLDGHASFVNDSRRQFMFLGPPRGILQPRTAICGFQARVRNEPLCFDVNRVGTYFANYTTPRGIEFSIDRQQLLDTDASRRFASETAQLIHSGYREFLTTVGAQSAKSIFELNAQSRMFGGEVPDTLTGRELAEAFSNYPDLLCFKMIPVRLDADVRAVDPEYLNLSALAKRSGTIWVIQNYYHVPVGGGRFASFYEDSLLPFAYSYATRVHGQLSVKEDMFVVEPHRLASMLFDCDPNSTVEFVKAVLVPGVPEVEVCIQKISLGSVGFAGPAAGILAEIQGRWSGAVYLRDFVTPNGKPYVFLGRSRVLIQKSSRLRSRLEDLKAEGRLIKLAETIAFLQDDEAGFTPASVADLL